MSPARRTSAGVAGTRMFARAMRTVLIVIFCNVTTSSATPRLTVGGDYVTLKLYDDLRDGARSLRKQPRFLIVASLTPMRTE